ncbi:MAG: hypothetical protein F6K48_09110, partial [Okeania sp. SIO3H1]|nr:hypothetical protein [Okeania sp. SIO3H1]
SEIFGQKLNKSNFIATVERLGFANYHSRLFNPVQIGSLNLCSNSETAELENSYVANTQSNYKKTTSCQPIVENVLYKTKLNTVSKLIKLGLTAEQIAEAVDLPLDEVQQLME